MIRPNMATMLAYIATDTAVEDAVLQAMLAAAVEMSFNRITMDGDTSTNDACVLVATADAGNPPLAQRDSALGLALRGCGGTGVPGPRPGHGARRRGCQQVCDGAGQWRPQERSAWMSPLPLPIRLW